MWETSLECHRILVFLLKWKRCIRAKDKPTPSEIPKPVALGAAALMLDSLKRDRLQLLSEAQEAATATMQQSVSVHNVLVLFRHTKVMRVLGTHTL